MTDKEKILTAIQKRMEFQKTCIKNDYRLTGKAEEEIIFEYQKLINFIDSIQEEPVSEDLEEAADEYAPDFSNSIASKAAVNAVRDAFKAGAKWQKEQLLAEAVDGTIRPNDGEIWFDFKFFNFEDGDKVKVIIIKED